MNIWIINHYAMPPEYETRIRTNAMAKYLTELGHSVKIISASTIHNTKINLMANSKELFVEKKYDDLNFVHINTRDYDNNGISRVINMIQFPIKLLRISRKLNDSPDIIICDLGALLAFSPYLISKFHKAKFILEVRDLWPESIIEYKNLSRNNPFVKMMYLLEKFIYKKSDIVIFSMEGGKDYIVDKGWDKSIRLEKIHHVNNGVDLDVFHFNHENYRIIDKDLDNEETFKVMYTGSIRLANNVKRIVDAAEIIKNKDYEKIMFIIYGEGTDREYLEKYCKENNINNIIFKGAVQKEKIPYILSKGNLNIMHFGQNSLKKYGASLNKMFEYFASGKPTISDCEFGYDLIKRYDSGSVFDNANSEQLADMVIRFYEMPKVEYYQYCKNAKVAAKDFDLKNLIKKVDKIIQSI